MQGKRILLGVTGSIAAYKAAELARGLVKRGASVQVALTEAGQRFIAPLTFSAITHRPALTGFFQGAGGEIQHVERAHEVDAFVVAPATAHTIARLALGLADDIVAGIALSTRAPIVIAPAMESGMWTHPATQANVARLVDRGATIVAPGEGDLASGRTGVGRLAEIDDIITAVERALEPRREADLAGRKALVTAGPTFEPLDPVRGLGNRSTGAMGVEIAKAAAARGADTTLLLGPTALAPPDGVTTVRIDTAQQMLDAGLDAIEGADILIAAAAVSDFRPARPHAAKLKRSAAGAHTLELVENPDVLATLCQRLRGSPQTAGAIVVGFAAETESVEANARTKLAKKGCDLVIGNEVGPDRGFGGGRTHVIAVRADAASVPFGPASKPAVADFVLDQVVLLLEQRAPG